MEVQFSRLQPRQFVRENVSRVGDYLNENRDFFELYRLRGTILSFFAPLLLAVHVFLFVEAVESFSFMTFVNLFLSLLLLLPWGVVPGLFLYVGGKNSQAQRIWGWIWVILMIGAEIYWFVYLTSF